VSTDIRSSLGAAEPTTRVVAAVVAAGTAGVLGNGVMPLLVGALVDGRGLSEAAAGTLLTIELAAAGIASLALARHLRRASRFRWGLLGALLGAIGHAASAGVTGYEGLAVARALAGLGEGTCLAVSAAAIAGVRDPERLFATAALVEGLLIGLLLVVLPPVITSWGAAGAFASLALLSAAAIPFMRWLPPGRLEMHDTADTRASHLLLATATLSAMFLMSITGMAIWALSERIGVRVGLDANTIGLVLGGSTIGGLLGAGAAAWLGTSRGRAGPLLGGIAISTVSMFFIAMAALPLTYVAHQIIWGIAFLFTTPYILGVAAALDPGGRWAAAATGVSSAGTALGPLLGGLLAASAGWLAGAVALCGAAAVLLMLPVLPRLGRLRTLEAPVYRSG
jgi:MFS family permease